MPGKHRVPARKRSQIGEVVSPIESLLAAREVSSCCVGVEAMLETRAEAIAERLRNRRAESESYLRRK